MMHLALIHDLGPRHTLLARWLSNRFHSRYTKLSATSKPHLTSNLPFSLKQVPSEQQLIHIRNSLASLDAREWLSSAVTSEADVSQLQLALNVLQNDLSSQFETSLNLVLSNVNRIALDLELVQRSLSTLETTVNGAKDPPDEATSATFDSLAKLSTLHSRMGLARRSLKDAEKWALFAGDMDALLAQDDIKVAADRLGEALAALKDLAPSQVHEKQALVATYQNKMEALLSPRVFQAFANKDTPKLLIFWSVFSTINRQDEFLTLYYQVRKSAFTALWHEENAPFYSLFLAEFPIKDFISQIDDLFREFVSLLAKEIEFSSDIFQNVFSVLHGLMKHVVDSLAPLIMRKLSLMNEAGNFSALFQSYVATRQFVATIENTLASVPDSDDVNFKQSKISKIQDHSSWSCLLLECFLPYQQNHSAFEKKFLLDSLDPLFNQQNRDMNEVVIRLTEKLPVLFKYADMALHRCGQFTSGLSLPSIVSTLNAYFRRTSDRITELVAKILKEKAVKDPKAELGDQNEWIHFQTGLQVLNLFKVFQGHWNNWTLSSTKTISSLVNKINSIVSNPDSESPVTKVEGGYSEVAMLRSSTLNNKKLHDFLKLTDPFETQLYQPIQMILQEAIRSSQAQVFGIVTANVKQVFGSMASRSEWSETSVSVASPFNLSVPQFSKSPSSWITNVGEYMLTLPQHLDTFHDHPGFSLSLSTLPYVQPADIDTLKEEYGDEEELSPTHVWIFAICKAVMEWLWEGIVSIPHLSQDGALQLFTDVEYTINVLVAMDITIEDRLKIFLDNVKDDVAVLDGRLDEANEATRAIISKILEMKREKPVVRISSSPRI